MNPGSESVIIVNRWAVHTVEEEFQGYHSWWRPWQMVNSESSRAQRNPLWEKYEAIRWYFPLALVSFTVTLLTSKPKQSHCHRHWPVHAHLTWVKRRNRCGASCGNRENIILESWLTWRCRSEFHLRYNLIQPLFWKIFILNWDTWMVGWCSRFWEWRIYNLLFCAITSNFPPSSFQSRTACFLTHRIRFCWNLSLFPVVLVLIHLRITLSLLNTVYLVHYDAQGRPLLILYLND